jgi:hypothetical protein
MNLFPIPNLIEFVDKELGMLLLWVTEDKVQSGPLSVGFFSNVGVKIAPERAGTEERLT